MSELKTAAGFSGVWSQLAKPSVSTPFVAVWLHGKPQHFMLCSWLTYTYSLSQGGSDGQTAHMSHDAISVLWTEKKKHYLTEPDSYDQSHDTA